jgi:hypothetical protein
MVSPDKNIVAALRVSMGIDLQDGLSIDGLKNIITDYINSLISNNFNKLISILYRLDINESKLKQLLAANPGEDAGMIIAELIIERQLQKIKTRSENNNTNIIPDDDKW